MKTLFLIDANSLIHRSFHALPPLTAPDGQPSQAIYGLASIFLRLWREGKPSYAAALFDRPEPTFRKKIFEAYKAQRPAAPDELISQIIEAHNFFSEFGIKTFEKPGYEADDCIATLAQEFKNIPDLKVVIFTGDMDTMQLVEGEKVVVRTFKKGISETIVYDENAVVARYGLRPNQMTDYKALVGDPSDNIKGVPGVGPKTAAALLQEFGTLGEIYKSLGKIKIGEKLKTYEKEAFLSKELVVLERNVPLEAEGIQELAVRDNQENLASYFKKLGFESLVKRLESGVKGAVPQKETSQGSMFNPAAGAEGTKSLVSRELGREAILVADIPEKLPLEALKSKKLKVGFGLKSTLKKLWAKKKDLAPPYFDLRVAFWLLDPDFKDYRPESVSVKFLKREWRNEVKDLEEARSFCREKLAEFGMDKLYQTIEMPVLHILAEMENRGILVNRKKLEEMERKIEHRLSELTGEIYHAAGEEFNINSPQQLSRIIYEKLSPKNGLRAKKTPGGRRSTQAENLLALQDKFPVVKGILEYRENFKILSTYLKPFQERIGADGRLHTDFIQTGTATGRLSSQTPNLQNIPQESPWAKELRGAFEAPKGFSLLALDYSQLELRILAALAEDRNMIEAFERNTDIHAATAAKIFDVPLDKVQPEMRRVAKTLNFGLIYGMGAPAFARVAGASREQAAKFIGAYFKEFPNIKIWQEKIKKDARAHGYVETLTGRRRYLPGIASGVPRMVAEAERAAVNQPIQGLEADIIKLAMIKAKAALREKGWWGTRAKLILSIHDELLFEVADSMISTIAPLVRDTMEAAYRLSVPLVADVSAGPDWGSLKKLEYPAS